MSIDLQVDRVKIPTLTRFEKLDSNYLIKKFESKESFMEMTRKSSNSLNQYQRKKSTNSKCKENKDLLSKNFSQKKSKSKIDTKTKKYQLNLLIDELEMQVNELYKLHK